MSVEQPLEAELLVAQPAGELGGVGLGPGRGHLLAVAAGRGGRRLNVAGQRVLDAETTVDHLDRGVGGKAQLKSILFKQLGWNKVLLIETRKMGQKHELHCTVFK